MAIPSAGLGMLAAAAILVAQNPPRSAFEVASIRPSVGTPQPGVVAGVRVDGSQVRATFLSVKDYIAAAYRLKLYQISGPDWIGTERFDVSATLPEGSTPGQLPEMLQALLTDRFQLKFHKEKKE